MMDDSDPLNIRSGEDTDTDDERTNEGNAALHRGSMGSRGSRVLFRRLVGAGSGIDYNQLILPYTSWCARTRMCNAPDLSTYT